MSRPHSKPPTRQSGAEIALADRLEAEAAYPPSRLNHLGLPKEGRFGQRYKYAKTFTMISGVDKKKQDQHKAHTFWQLIEDVSRAVDMSMPRLHAMLKAFKAAQEVGATLVGPRTFRAVLAQFNITDAILVRRMFIGFCGCSTKVDYRDLLRTFVSVADVPVEAKVELVVPLFDVEGGGVDLSEFTMMVVKSVQANMGDVGASRIEQERRELGLSGTPPLDLIALLGEETVVEIEEVWRQIKEEQEKHAAKSAPRPDDYEHDAWAAKNAGGIGLGVLLAACTARPMVHDFLSKHLKAHPCRAVTGTVDPLLDVPTVVRNFYHRLLECETDVFKSVTLGTAKPKPQHSSPVPKIMREEGKQADGEVSAGRLRQRPIWLERGTASAAETWTTTALVRRKHGTHTRTDLLAKHQHSTKLNAMMPLRHSETFAELVEPKALHMYLNRTRSEAGLPPLTSKVEHLLSPRRSRLLRSTKSTSSAATI